MVGVGVVAAPGVGVIVSVGVIVTVGVGVTVLTDIHCVVPEQAPLLTIKNNDTAVSGIVNTCGKSFTLYCDGDNAVLVPPQEEAVHPDIDTV